LADQSNASLNNICTLRLVKRIVNSTKIKRNGDIMSKTRIEGFKLIGLQLGKKTTNENGQSGIDCGTLWQKFETENIAGKIPDTLGNEIYAVYFDYEGDYTKPFSYFIGCKVPSGAEAPNGMDSLLVPSDNYTKVTAKGKMPDCIANAWKDIWSSKINRADNYDFEIYDERSKEWSNAEVDIFVSSV
jgi:predicted transcriptional regulator YdeE